MNRVFNLDQQIGSTPRVIREILDGAAPPALDLSRPIILTGIGTSLHAARVAADWFGRLSGGEIRPAALDAHDVGTHTPLTSDDQVVVISHRGNKIFPRAALRRAAEAGATTIAIVGRDAPEQTADSTLRTCPNESAGTFSVSYLGSLTVLARLAAQAERGGAAGFAAALKQLPEAVDETLRGSRAAAAAKALLGASPILFVGFGADLPTAQETALKVKEGAWIWTEAMSPEFALHGTPASFHTGMGAVLITPTENDGDRMETLHSALRELQFKAVLRCGEEADADLPFVAPHPLLRPITGMLPLQQLTAELARLRETDPDTMHGGREPWRTVMTGLTL